MTPECRRVFFSGRVQGVGFRASCHYLARGFEVAGYVRNLDDGRVEVLVEGPTSEIERFLASIRTEMTGYIDEERSEPEPLGENALHGFRIQL